MTLRRTPGHIHYGPIKSAWSALPRGYIDGLILSRDAGDTDHDINIAAGVCRDSTNTVNMTITDITKQVDATWAVGNDAGGLNATDFATGGSGPEASTWYHVFVIQHTDGTTDAGFDKDVSAANLLTDSGYTYYRRVGSVLTDGSENFLSFTQYGDEFMWAAIVLDVATGAVPTSRTNYALTVAPDVKVWAWFEADMTEAANIRRIYMTSPDQDDDSPTYLSMQVLGQTDTGIFRLRTNTSRQITAKATAADADLNINTMGWVDPRGKDV